MDNVKMTLDADRLIIEIDLGVRGTPSASGKTTVIASTRGNADVPGVPGLRVGLNVFRKR